MRARFALWFATLACLLGVMLTVVAGHVRSVVHDWAEANFRLGDEAYVLTVHPDPAGEASNATRSAGINKELRSWWRGRTSWWHSMPVGETAPGGAP